MDNSQIVKECLISSIKKVTGKELEDAVDFLNEDQKEMMISNAGIEINELADIAPSYGISINMQFKHDGKVLEEISFF